MKKSWYLWLLLVVIFLAGCQSSAPTATVDQPQEPVDPTGVVEPTLTGEVPSGDEYPAPSEELQSPDQVGELPSVLYPGPQDGDRILWHQTEAMVLNNEVTLIVFTGEPLWVKVSLKDGRTFLSRMTYENQFQEFLATCGDPCEEITIEE